MEKKIAALIRERQDEALRMALGITLCDDIIDIFVLDRKLDPTEKNRNNMRVVKELEMSVFTNCKDNDDMEMMTTEKIAEKLLSYDTIIPY
ncbi:hypothetical protein MNBD_NITROSPINAE04-2450 [hydrothermal vent metagenome]|uniref:Uncharacterized protein n=2 Tax=hydrothermal vent metagenome TaxID=652676 RepID=A0A3B1BJT9_9ZZZZ